MDQLVVALDVDNAAAAGELADSLRGIAGAFKVGSRLFTAEGPGVVRWLAERGHRVFLDLKFHDIPHTVAGAVAAAARMDVWMLTVHAGGGAEMMRAAKAAAADTASGMKVRAPLVVAVTVLTSLDERGLVDLGVARPLRTHVDILAQLALRAGLDGVVASPLDARRLRSRCGEDFVIVTPGIRAAGPAAAPRQQDDQVRTLSAAEALREGASYIVVGRPIIAARDPRAAAEHLVAEAGR